MALNVATLANALMDLTDDTRPGWPGLGVLSRAASLFVSAYDDYAQAAQDLGGNKLASGNIQGMQTALQMAFLSPMGSAEAAAQAFGQAHTAYWSGAAFKTGLLPITGSAVILGGDGIFSYAAPTVITPSSTAGFVGQILDLFTHPTTDALDHAAGLAEAWHNLTKTIALSVTGLDTTPPPAGPLTITATGFVF